MTSLAFVEFSSVQEGLCALRKAHICFTLSLFNQRQRERERERETDIYTDTERERERGGERQTDRDSERQRLTDRERQTDRQTDRDREGEIKTCLLFLHLEQEIVSIVPQHQNMDKSISSGGRVSFLFFS